MGYCLKIGPTKARYKDLISIMQMNIFVSDLGGEGGGIGGGTGLSPPSP